MSKFCFMTGADPENGKWDGISMRDLTINLFMHKFIEPRWDSWAELDIVLRTGEIGKVINVSASSDGDIVAMVSTTQSPSNIVHNMAHFIERIQLLYKEGTKEEAKIKFCDVDHKDQTHNIRIIEIKDNVISLKECL